MTFTKRQSLMLITMIALGLAFAFLVFTKAQSQNAELVSRGPYMLAGGDRTMIWRIDQGTGQVSFCTRDTNSQDRTYLPSYSPFCSAWSK